MASIWEELKRRNVVKVAVAYAIVGWLLIEVTSTVLPTFEAPQWVVQTITFVIMLGFPLSLIFAWAYELTPEGLKKETDVDDSESITHITGRKLNFVIITVLVLALAFFGFDKFVLDPVGEVESTEMADKSIAVLAFADMSPEGDQEYFSDGVSEEILNGLAQIPELRVTSRTSAFRFKGEGVDIPTVARQLGVANVLEGSVRKSGNLIRITAQLIDARTDTHVWSNTYEGELENIFALQDEISAAIVIALKGHLGLNVEAAPRAIAAANTEAHEAYLRGQHLLIQSTSASIEGASREFENAIALDPDYAPAHAGMALAILDMTRNDSEAVARAAPYVDRAMALDPAFDKAHGAAGRLLARQAKWEEALTYFRQAIQINPNYVIVYVWMGSILDAELGRYDEAFQMRAAAMQLDPLSVPTIVRYQEALIERDRFAEAARELEKIASIHPHVYAYRRGTRTSRGGNWANAVIGGLDALRIDPDFIQIRPGVAYMFAMLDLADEALTIADSPGPYVLNDLGRPQDAVTFAEARVADDPISQQARHDLGLALASVGDYAGARPILEEMWQRSGGTISKRSDIFRTVTAAALIAIRRDAGEDAETDELIAAIRDNVRRYREAGIVGDDRYFGVDFEEGLAAYLSGDRESGLALLDKATASGIFIPTNDAYLQALYDDPEFAPMLARQAERQVCERNKLLAIVCTDNPYAAVWQPAEGSCERLN